MADVLTIIAELGENTDLLMAPDAWLETQRVSLQQRMSIIVEELTGILAAQKIKRQLQQTNMVAVQCVEPDDDGFQDIVIKICPITDAVRRLDSNRSDPMIPEDISETNARQQADTWKADGYDVEAARRIAKQRRRA